MSVSKPPVTSDDTGQSSDNHEKANNAARAHAKDVGIRNADSPPFHDGSGNFMHFCSHPGCTEWGAFGSCVRLLQGKLGTWTCWKHRAARPVKEKKPSAKKRPSGRLL